MNPLASLIITLLLPCLSQMDTLKPDIWGGGVSRIPASGQQLWEERAPHQVFFHVKTTKRIVALTFDDGPHPSYTPAILAVLHAHHAHGTFFVVGNEVKHYPHILREIIRDGNELGNHTSNHPKLSQLTEKEIRSCDELIEDVTGFRPVLLRPPGGHISDRLLTLSRKTGHVLIMWTWDVDAKDWMKPGIRTIVQKIVDHVDPGDIIILHDGGGKRSQTVEALPIILSDLARRGYACVSVSELFRQTHIQREGPQK